MFSTVDMVCSVEYDTLVQCIIDIIHAYNNKVLKRNITNMCVQLEALRGNRNGIYIDLSVPSDDEHVPTIERYIKTMK